HGDELTARDDQHVGAEPLALLHSIAPLDAGLERLLRQVVELRPCAVGREVATHRREMTLNQRIARTAVAGSPRFEQFEVRLRGSSHEGIVAERGAAWRIVVAIGQSTRAVQHDLSPGEALALAQLQSKVLGEPVAPVFVGPYRLVRKLGEGGFGEVFLAYDTLHERRVALKLLRDDEETGAPRRLVREGKAIAALEHPNIVRCYEIGDATGTTPVYVALEYIEGETVRAWIERTSPSWEAIVEVFVAAGEALAYAHRRGIVHRDFKPSNVMVSARGEVKVLDFGLVCTMPDVSATGFTDQLTAPGTVRG